MMPLGRVRERSAPATKGAGVFRMTRIQVAFAVLVLPLAACKPVSDSSKLVPSLVDAGIFVNGVAITNTDCRSAMCPHNEDTDMYRWNDAIYMVHRTAKSQILGPDSSLHVYRSTDEGATFTQTAVILAPAASDTPDAGFGDGGFDVPSGRDLRDPSFYTIGNDLYMKALTRLPFSSEADTGVNTITVETHTSDGENWSAMNPMAPADWSFWRIKKQAGIYYSAAYHDGDASVSLFSSPDGTTWTQGAEIYGVAANSPLETELTFMPLPSVSRWILPSCIPPTSTSP